MKSNKCCFQISIPHQIPHKHKEKKRASYLQSISGMRPPQRTTATEETTPLTEIIKLHIGHFRSFSAYVEVGVGIIVY